MRKLLIILILVLSYPYMLTPQAMGELPKPPPEPIQVAQVTPVEEVSRGAQYDREEIDLLCKLVQAEAGNQNDMARQRVAEVVLNRTEYYNMTITATIYSGVFDSDVKLSITTPDEITRKAVNFALNSDKRIDALWLCDDSVENFPSKFSQPIELVEQQDRMLFWRLQ